MMGIEMGVVFATILLLAVLTGLAGSAINIRSAIKGKPKEQWADAVEFRYKLHLFACLPITSFIGMYAPFVVMGIGALLCGLLPSFRAWVIGHFYLIFPAFIGVMLSTYILGAVFESLFNKWWVKRFAH